MKFLNLKSFILHAATVLLFNVSISAAIASPDMYSPFYSIGVGAKIQVQHWSIAAGKKNLILPYKAQANELADHRLVIISDSDLKYDREISGELMVYDMIIAEPNDWTHYMDYRDLVTDKDAEVSSLKLITASSNTVKIVCYEIADFVPKDCTVREFEVLLKQYGATLIPAAPKKL